MELKKGIGIGFTAKFNFSKEKLINSTWISYSDKQIVVYEMQHKFDYDKGNMTDGFDKPVNTNNPAEIRAVNTENKVNIQSRTIYARESIDPKKK